MRTKKRESALDAGSSLWYCGRCQSDGDVWVWLVGGKRRKMRRKAHIEINSGLPLCSPEGGGEADVQHRRDREGGAPESL